MTSRWPDPGNPRLSVSMVFVAGSLIASRVRDADAAATITATADPQPAATAGPS